MTDVEQDPPQDARKRRRAEQEVAGTQRELDRVRRSYGGQPVARVRPHVRAALQRSGWTFDDEELQRYAEAIAGGERVVLAPSRLS